jgi:hypothetical protein
MKHTWYNLDPQIFHLGGGVHLGGGKKSLPVPGSIGPMYHTPGPYTMPLCIKCVYMHEMCASKTFLEHLATRFHHFSGSFPYPGRQRMYIPWYRLDPQMFHLGGGVHLGGGSKKPTYTWTHIPYPGPTHHVFVH